MREDMDSLRAILAEFDADAAEELAKEGERADLWTDIDVPVALVRALLDDNERLRKANRKLHRRAQAAEAFSQAAHDIPLCWRKVYVDNWPDSVPQKHFVYILGAIIDEVMKRRERAARLAHQDAER